MDKSLVKSIIKKLSTQYGTSYFLNDGIVLSDTFTGDELLVAKVYQESLKVESSEHGVTCDTVPNARSRTMITMTKPVKKEINNPCTRCDGTGIMPYRHIKNGKCFKCSGTGKNVN